jgi:hypothetical protein
MQDRSIDARSRSMLFAQMLPKGNNTFAAFALLAISRAFLVWRCSLPFCRSGNNGALIQAARAEAGDPNSSLPQLKMVCERSALLPMGNNRIW